MKVTRSQIRQIIQESEQQRIDEGAWDWIQGGLDVVGLIPGMGVGEAADALNVVISLGRRKLFDAAMSAISLIPAAGDVVGKAGKYTAKLLGPVMDMIKAGKKSADILRKLGPKTVNKLRKTIPLLRDAIAKYSTELGKLFEAVKKADLENLEKLLKIEVPKAGRSKAKSLLKKASENMDTDGLKKVLQFIKDAADDLKADEESKGKDKEVKSEIFSPRGYPLAEGSLLGPALLGDEYVNERFEHLMEVLDGLSEKE